MRLLDKLRGKSSQDSKNVVVNLVQGYCFKCKETRTIDTPVDVTMKNGRLRTQGACAVCGTKMSTMAKAQRAPAEQR